MQNSDLGPHCLLQRQADDFSNQWQWKSTIMRYTYYLREVSNRYTCISHKEKDCLKEYVIPVFFLLNILVICGQKIMHLLQTLAMTIAIQIWVW